MAYDRYSRFRENGEIKIIPKITLPVKTSDKYVQYERGKTRLDVLSYQYYNDANYGWLIMLANPQYSSLEFLIPDKAQLRIPYPLDNSLRQYESQIDLYIQTNGI